MMQNSGAYANQGKKKKWVPRLEIVFNIKTHCSLKELQIIRFVFTLHSVFGVGVMHRRVKVWSSKSIKLHQHELDL